MAAERVRQYLEQNGVDFAEHSHATTYTTVDTAEVEHLTPAGMAKVVFLDVDDRLVMVVVPGDRTVDLGKVLHALEASSVEMAGEADFAPAFPDCEVGAEPPFGLLYGVRTVVDEALTSDAITFPAGSHKETISMALDDYLALIRPERADLTRKSAVAIM